MHVAHNHFMEVRELQWFLALAETEHVTDAAAGLNITQPTLSRAIARLEKGLGVPLFDRHQNRLRLNRYGEVFRAHAIRAVAELDSAEARISTLIDPSIGTVSLSFLHSFGGWLVPNLIAAYRATSPNTTFELRGDAADTVVDDIRHGRVDLGFVSPRPTGADLTWIELAREELYLLLPAGHRHAGRESVALAEVASDDFVGLAPQFGLRQVTDRLCAEAGFSARWTMVCTEVSTLRSLVAADLGVSVVPAPHDDKTGPSTLTRLVRIEGSEASRPVGMVTVESHLRAPAILRFYDFVRHQSHECADSGNQCPPTQ